MQFAEIADGPEVRALCAHNGEERRLRSQARAILRLENTPHAQQAYSNRQDYHRRGHKGGHRLRLHTV